MFSLFKSKDRPRPVPKGVKRAARNAKRREYYSDPLPFSPAPPPFNIFTLSTYKSLFSTPAPAKPYVAVWCPATKSVNVFSDVEGEDIWRRGMWGKGTLSRSQPTWRQRKTKEMTGGVQLNLEDITALKRRERAEFKEERLKKERIEREKQLRAESDPNKPTIAETGDEQTANEDQPKRKRRRMTLQTDQELPVYSEDYLDKEVFQLAPEEALFLMHLNLLVVQYKNEPVSLHQFLHLVSTTSRTDDPFLVRYVVYYHFRRQRLIVKPGLKFGVDYLLYDGPIPFVHAGHCVNIIGNYHLWEESGERLVREQITWQEINLWQRLMGNVRKRLKLVYVEIPRMTEKDWRDVDGREDLEKVLQRYRVREVMNSRMIIAKERDVKDDK